MHTEKKYKRIETVALSITGGVLALAILAAVSAHAEKIDKWQPSVLPTRTWGDEYRFKHGVVDAVTGEYGVPTPKTIYKCPWGELTSYEPHFEPVPANCNYDRTEVELR